MGAGAASGGQLTKAALQAGSLGPLAHILDPPTRQELQIPCLTARSGGPGAAVGQGPSGPERGQAPRPPGGRLPLGVVGRVLRCLLQQSHVAEHTGEDEEHGQGVGAPESRTRVSA